MIKEKAVEVIKQLLKDEEEQGDIFFTNEDKTALKFAIKILSAPVVPQITVFTESTDEKAVADLKAELQSILDSDSRPKGEWIKHIDDLFPEDSFEECPFCHEEQRLVGNDDNFCPNCGAKLKMPY